MKTTALQDGVPIESKFGQGKRCFSLSKIMSKLSKISETAILESVYFLIFDLFMKP